MQLFAWGIGCGSAWIVLARAPYSGLVRRLVVFGYFPFYEYCAKSRGYGLGLLLLFAALALIDARRARVVASGVVLALLFHTSIPGAILAAALAVVLLVDRLADRDAWRRDGAGPGIEACALALVVFAAVTAVLAVSPAADSGLAHWRGDLDLEIAQRVVSRVAHAGLPLLELSYFPVRYAADHWLGIALIAGSSLLLLSRPLALLFYLVSTLGLLGFMYLGYEGLFWHHGHLFLAWIAAFWLAEIMPRASFGTAVLRRAADRAWRLRAGLLVPVLLVHVFTGVRAQIRDWREPYSQGLAAAQFIRDEGLDDLLLVSDPDYTAASVLAHLERGTRAYFTQGKRYGSFVRWDRARIARVLPGRPALRHARKVGGGTGESAGRDVLFIASYEMPGTLPPWVRELARFEGAIWPDENFYLYRLEVGR